MLLGFAWLTWFVVQKVVAHAISISTRNALKGLFLGEEHAAHSPP
jgi:hypothetical protein